jgi:SAM-dependent methyltransferase
VRRQIFQHKKEGVVGPEKLEQSPGSKALDVAKPPIGWFTESVLTVSALIAATKLGLWKALEGRNLSLTELSQQLDATPQGLNELLPALAHSGMLEIREDDRFSLSRAAETWFTSRGRADYTPLVLWWVELLPEMVNLDKAVKDNRSFLGLWQRMQEKPDMGRNFSQFMKQSAQMLVGPLLQALQFPDEKRRLLDIGGSHGLFTLELCRRYPRFESTIFDLSAALSETADHIARYALGDRVRTQAGDFYTDPLGSGYDIVLTLRFLHDHPDYKIKVLLRKIYEALVPGGEYVALTMLKDQVHPENALFSLLFYYEDGGRNLRYSEIEAWLREARFVDVIREELSPGQFSIVRARKPR